MSDIVIRVENLSKQYRLGQVGTGTLGHDLNRWWHTVRGKEDPYLIVGEENERSVKGSSEYVWALQNINFEVKQGEILGIIGRNGAGKSTLLKILSRTTSPTTGSVKLKGRIASLLEVGTGFHPELSGKENIFLNGAILGMTKSEIKSKFDEIVNFSGVERYIDTPVKRYSSGMYVRLAFGVAAHLESEILIVDEVLAVGDAEFQRKCLRKMGDVSKGEGRTVIFVSHNMTAMNTLCERVVYMKNGGIDKIGQTREIINYYLNSTSDNVVQRIWDIANAPGDENVKLLGIKISDDNGDTLDSIDFYEGGNLELTYQILKYGYHPVPNIHIFNQHNEYIFVTSPNPADVYSDPGIYTVKAELPHHFLNVGRYLAGVAITTIIPLVIHFYEEEALRFDVVENMEHRDTDFRGAVPGTIRPLLKWKTKKNN